MPCFQVQTNSQSKVTDSQLATLSAALSKTTGKPETYISISIRRVESMFFGGSSEPTAICELSSIGKIGPEENKQHAATLTPIICEILNIQSDRFYIFYKNCERHDVSWKGHCFHNMPK